MQDLLSKGRPDAAASQESSLRACLTDGSARVRHHCLDRWLHAHGTMGELEQHLYKYRCFCLPTIRTPKSVCPVHVQSILYIHHHSTTLPGTGTVRCTVPSLTCYNTCIMVHARNCCVYTEIWCQRGARSSICSSCWCIVQSRSRQFYGRCAGRMYHLPSTTSRHDVAGYHLQMRFHLQAAHWSACHITLVGSALDTCDT